MFRSLNYDHIIVQYVIAYGHGLHYKHYTRMKMSKFHFNEKKTRYMEV